MTNLHRSRAPEMVAHKRNGSRQRADATAEVNIEQKKGPAIAGPFRGLSMI
ncbi:MAG: hypothetical protein ACI9TP_000780 [Candidatus Azotimanducaceae bacterium]|jgi:hypothetical protein